MDRLTEIYFDEFGIKHARLKDNIAKKTYRSYTFTPQEIANEKLAELEDFMEKHKCHSVGDLMLEFTISAVDKLNLKLTEEKLAEMKAKLAESESELDRYAELFGMKGKDFYVVEKTEYEKMKQGAKEIVDQLKQQLAEKDAEVQSWKDGTMVVKLGKLEEQLAEKEKEYKFKLKEMDNEYKKEFKTFEEDCKHLYKTPTKKAIEELEKVKEYADVDYRKHCYINAVELDKFINQQIKKLKGDGVNE